MTEYLNTSASVVISSPAGSGKTEKLSRRYIALLESGARVDRILSITFTEKAAAEMKLRILKILEAEHKELFERVRPEIPLMRISTIHAFCLKVLKRFSVELGMDPSLEVMDASMAWALWEQAVSESIMAERGDDGPFFRLMRERGFKGMRKVRDLLAELHSHTPMPERMAEGGGPVPQEAAGLMEAYGICLRVYREKKRVRHALDFNDLELYAYKALALGPQAYNILYSFDERTDHILVDEFQDTSTLQWDILDRLTEEWRSGLGAKRESGTTPTVFLVGDDKQSIYLFRGANVSVFHNARRQLDEWMGGECRYIQVEENYRSLPAIIEFVNQTFHNLMPPQESLWPWMTMYAPFSATRREDAGRVDLLLFEPGEDMPETRAKEAALLARMIAAIVAEGYPVWRDGQKRACAYGDIAVLIKKRTHLGAFEDAMRAEGIPFIVLGGVGFYGEPEVAILMDLISFIVDPADRHSLISLLRSPLFQIGYGQLYNLAKHDGPLIDAMAESDTDALRGAASTLRSLSGMSASAPLAELIEHALPITKGWESLRERQRMANIRKFISIVEGLEQQGMSPIEIRAHLIAQSEDADVPKANVSAQGMDAVEIMTIHAAKGLQFPIVFLPGMDERSTPDTSPIVFDDTGGTVRMGFNEDAKLRGSEEIFRTHKLKEEAEDKRLFYVAATRAMDRLIMSGAPKEGALKGRLAYLEGFDLFGDKADRPLNLLTEADLPPSRGSQDMMSRPAYVAWPPEGAHVATAPLEHCPLVRISDVAGELEPTGSHGAHWTVIGTVMHALFEELSSARLTLDALPARARVLMREYGGLEEHLPIILRDMDKLVSSGIMDRIIMPRAGAHAELPFVLDKGAVIYRGRMDRVIVEGGVVHVYDYKTFPAPPSERAGVIDKYRFQMRTYSEAAGRIFGIPSRAHLVLTHVPEVIDL